MIPPRRPGPLRPVLGERSPLAKDSIGFSVEGLYPPRGSSLACRVIDGQLTSNLWQVEANVL